MINITIVFIVSIIGINIKERITNILINDKPVLKDNRYILLISKLYLQIFNLLYFIFLLLIE